MYNLVVVGAGSLGEAFCVELARKAGALKLPLKIKIVDFDTVEERNIYSQGFLPSDIGKFKAEVIAERISQFEGVEVSYSTEKLTEENIDSLVEFDENTTIVDAVDNFPTRCVLWETSYVRRCPVLHLSMTIQGDGHVSWNFAEQCDTFPLSPARMSAEKKKALSEREEDKLPPCQLNAFRNLILNTAITGVRAYTISTGNDNTNTLMDPETGENLAMRGCLTYWRTTSQEIVLDKSLTKVVDWTE